MVRCHGDKLNHPSLVHDDFVRKNKSRVDDYIILNYLLLITHLKIIYNSTFVIYIYDITFEGILLMLIIR